MINKFKMMLILPFLLIASCSDVTSNTNTTTSNTTSSSTNTTSTDKDKTTYQNIVNIYDNAGNNQSSKTIVADPSVYRDSDGTYYLYCTETFLFRGDRGYGKDKGPILKSKNLIDWDYAGSVFRYGKDEPIWGASGANVWAPDICKIGNKYVYYYSLALWGDANPGIGCASSDTPVGPWVQHGKIFDSNEINVKNSIDPQVIVEDGRVYMIWGSFQGIFKIELASDGLSVLSKETMAQDRTLIAGVETSYWDGAQFEGSYIIKKDNEYIYFGSSGSCCDGLNSTYKVLAGKSSTLFGDYKDKNNSSLKNSNVGTLVAEGKKDGAVGVGHNSITIDDAGDYWMIYHGFDSRESNPQRRLFIDKLLWDEKGYPYLPNHAASLGETKPAPKINK